MMQKILMLGLKYPVLVTMFMIVTTLFAAAGMSRVEIDTGMDSLIPASDPSRLIYQQVMGEFGSDNKTIIYIRDANLWTPEKLSILEHLHRGVAQIDNVDSVDSLFNLHTIHGEDGKV